jgi:hypothetical protein
MRLVCIYLLVSMAAGLTALGNPVPYDPEILIDIGGDATNIDYTGVPITVGANGGGIFVFHNATGNPLTELDFNLDFPLSPLPVGFGIAGSVGTNLSGQIFTFRPATFSGINCNGVASSTFSCIELTFKLRPGPLVPTDGNFVIDFNDSASYTALDLEVENGTYTGGDVPGGTGSWAPNGVPTSGSVDPFSAVPEPAYRYTEACMALGLVVVWNLRRRMAAKKS